MSLTPKSAIRKPKKAVQGQILLDNIFSRDADRGATFTECSGLQGSGKTSLALGFADKIMSINPSEIIYWRESVGTPCQFTKIGTGKYQILIEKDYPLEILEITNNLLPVEDVKIIYFTGLNDLYQKSKPKMLNVVYFKKPISWIDLILFLGNKPEWQSLFWDEYEDIVPQRCSNAGEDKQWSRNEQFAQSLKQLRKSRVSLFANTQSSMDVDVRVRSKIMYWVYLYGSRRDKISPVSKGAIQSLSVGSGWIDHGHSLYGQFTFPPYLPGKRIFTMKEILL